MPDGGTMITIDWYDLIVYTVGLLIGYIFGVIVMLSRGK